MCNADWKFSFAASKSSESNSNDSIENDVSSGIDTSDDDSENNTTISIDGDNKNDSSVNTDDGNNKNNTSVNTDNDNGINNTSTNTGDDNGKNNTSINTGDDNDKNNTSVNTGNDNGKNDTSAGTNNGKIPDKDVKHDIRIITECMIRSKRLGNLVMHITRLTKIVFLVVPSLRNPFINYFDYLFELVLNGLVQLNILLETIMRRNLSFLGSSILFPWKFKLKDYSNLFN